jgi:predicted sulfurtransferase
VGFDPCLVAKKKDMFSEYSEVSIEFQPVETFCKFERLLLDRCQVVECGVRLLHANDGLEEQCSKAREHINNYFDKILMDEMESISFRDNFNILLFC